MKQCNYCGYLKEVQDYRLIHEGEYWQLALSPDQQYLGKTFVTLKRHAEALKDLQQPELLELGEIFKRFENSLNSALQPTHFNWSCLMNMGVGIDGVPHVHWHAIPRFSEPRSINGVEFADTLTLAQ